MDLIFRHCYKHFLRNIFCLENWDPSPALIRSIVLQLFLRASIWLGIHILEINQMTKNRILPAAINTYFL